MYYSYESHELYHHGILGQKWGVRRFQNPDGTLTSEGKQRYNKFYKATENVKQKASNVIPVFKKNSINIDTVKERGNINTFDAKYCSKLAESKYLEASEKEPKITNDLIQAASNAGVTMYGLENRLKQPTSLAAKIGSDAKTDGVSYVDARNSIKDALRYTTISDDNNFVANYKTVKGVLEDKGYTETKCKNYYESFKNKQSSHKSIQCIFSDPDGYEFEIQFQTPASQAAKELKIPLYEEIRKDGVDPSRAKLLIEKMIKLADMVPDPDGVYTIKSHKK